MKRLVGAFIVGVVAVVLVAPFTGESQDLGTTTPAAGEAVAAAEETSAPTATESPSSQDPPTEEAIATGTPALEPAVTEALPTEASPAETLEAPPAGTSTESPAATSSPEPSATATRQSLVTLEFRPEADAWVAEDEPDDNFGDSPDLIVDGVDDPVIDSYLRFRVQGIRGSVERAVLRLRTRSTTWAGSVNGPAVYTAGNAWTERDITWENRPAALSGMLDNVGAVEISTWVTYDVTVAISADGTYTFLLSADSSDGIKFSSREGSSPPRLLVTLNLLGTQTPQATPTIAPPTSVPTGTAQPAPTDTPEPTATPVPTDTPEPAPTDTPEPSPTETSTETPVPTATPPATPVVSVLTVLPEADAFVSESNPQANFGTKTTLVVDGDTRAQLESFLRFNVSGITGTVTR